MGSHKHKKRYESETSSSESDSSSSSDDSRSKKRKYSKKSKHSSSEESDEKEKSHNKSKEKSSADSDRERIKKKVRESEEKSYGHKHRERDYRSEKSNESRHDEQYKSNDKYKSVDRDRSRDTRSDDRATDKERSRYKGRSKDDDIDETRNRREHNSRDKFEERDRDKRQDYRKDERSFKNEGNSRKYKNEDSYKGRAKEDRNRRDNRRNNRGRRSSPFDHANAKWGKSSSDEKQSGKKENQDKEKPNFGLSGKLTEETNTYKGVVIKYSEPPEARKARRRWRLYPFKGEKALQTLYIHRESAYLIGRERKVVDLPVDHPSCSKQHAALQYRLVPFTRDDGSSGKRVRPYLIDLESANGTFINNKKIESKKYVELFEKDVIKFGFSSREYVLLHENSKDETMDDDVKQEEEEIPVKEEPQ